MARGAAARGSFQPGSLSHTKLRATAERTSDQMGVRPAWAQGGDTGPAQEQGWLGAQTAWSRVLSTPPQLCDLGKIQTFLSGLHIWVITTCDHRAVVTTKCNDTGNGSRGSVYVPKQRPNRLAPRAGDPGFSRGNTEVQSPGRRRTRLRQSA